MRKDSLLHAHEKDDGELQALCRMKRHERHAVVLHVRRIDIGDECDLVEEIFQSRLFLRLFKLSRHADEFAQVLDARLRLGRILLLQVLDITCIVKQGFDKGRKRHSGKFAHEVKEKRGEGFEQILRARLESHSFERFGTRQDIEEGFFTHGGILRELGDRRCADAALGHVDDAQEAHGVKRVVEDVQIGNDVLDFHAVVELQAADHRIGNPRRHHGFFEDARLRIRAVKHGDVAIIDGKERLLLLHGIYDESCLVALVIRLIKGDLLPYGVFRPELLRLAVLIVSDDGIGCGQDILRRAIILLKLDRLRLGKVLLEIQDVADIRAAPAVDGLIGIADDAEIVMTACQKRCEPVLCAVRILIFVDEDVAETPLILLTQFVVIFQKVDGEQQEIVKIQSIVLAQLLVIQAEKLRNLLRMERIRLPRVGARAEHEILRVRYGVLHLCGSKLLVIKIQLLEARLDDGLGI